MVCPYCNGHAKYVDSKVIYGQSYGMVYWCRPCDAYVGTHKGTNKPFGTLANKKLREWRMKAHTMLSIVEGEIGRKAAYKWLAGVVQKPLRKTHIGMFSVEEC